MHEKHCKQPILILPEVETQHLMHHVRQEYATKCCFMGEAKQEILWSENE